MTELLIDEQNSVCTITFNRENKRNAFDHAFLVLLQHALDKAIASSSIRLIVLQANGKYFSAGADLAWMQATIHYTQEENYQDALTLANVLYTLHNSPKPTIAAIQGGAYGGGVGIVAACDIAIAGHSAHFCFSEVKLGLIPAVISPYIIEAIGERAAKWLFISADPISATRAENLGLVHHCVDDSDLVPFTLEYIEKILSHGPEAILDAKRLVRHISNKIIDKDLSMNTAEIIAKKRVSTEAQTRLQAFLNARKP